MSDLGRNMLQTSNGLKAHANSDNDLDSFLSPWQGFKEERKLFLTSVVLLFKQHKSSALESLTAGYYNRDGVTVGDVPDGKNVFRNTACMNKRHSHGVVQNSSNLATPSCVYMTSLWCVFNRLQRLVITL
jgi:hypothetical protein